MFFFFKNWTNQTKKKNVLKIIPYFASASCSKGMNPIHPIPYFTFTLLCNGINKVFFHKSESAQYWPG